MNDVTQTPETNADLIHATSLLIDGRAVLIAGASGTGKSDLALRLIDRGAQLISDDYTRLENRNGILFGSAVPSISGKIEVRGVGIVDIPNIGDGPVALLLDLDEVPERLPADPPVLRSLAGIAIPSLPFSALESSAPLKAELALRLYGLPVPR